MRVRHGRGRRSGLRASSVASAGGGLKEDRQPHEAHARTGIDPGTGCYDVVGDVWRLRRELSEVRTLLGLLLGTGAGIVAAIFLAARDELARSHTADEAPVTVAEQPARPVDGRLT